LSQEEPPPIDIQLHWTARLYSEPTIVRIPGTKEIARYIRAMNADEQDKLYEEIEKGDNLSNRAKDF